MKLKSVKGKLVAGVVTVGLVSGLGVAAASTDIGGQLQTWYNGQFGAAQSSMVTDASNHVQGKAAGVITEYNNGKAATANAINGAATNSITGAKTSINGAKDQYIKDLETRQATIENTIEAQFNGLFATAQWGINQAGTQVYNIAKNDFTKFAGDKGTAALGEVETQVNKAKDDAVSELEAAIATAKSDLQTQLDTEEAATTVEIKAAIDAKINALRGQMATLVSGLINTQQKLITDKASELEIAAKTALDEAAEF